NPRPCHVHSRNKAFPSTSARITRRCRALRLQSRLRLRPSCWGLRGPRPARRLRTRWRRAADGNGLPTMAKKGCR
ncbi:hypothetical protein HDU96_002707, partial [Phlyctochytrium bullatum]